MRAERLLRLYPRDWRERYGDEFLTLLESEPVGLRVVADVALAAARERVRVMTPGLLRFAGLYALIWLAVLGMQEMLTFGASRPRLHFFDGAEQARFLATFLWSALVARFVDSQLLSRRRQPASRTFVQVLGALESLAAVVAVYGVWSVAAWLVVAPPFVSLVILSGNLFGRRPEMFRVLNHVSAGTPRPPSFTTLGLSA